MKPFNLNLKDNSGLSHAVVIGSGFGGLAAAVHLRASGYRVTVLEAMDSFGGRARRINCGNYAFDAGPSIITAPYLLDELFHLLGRQYKDYFQLIPVDPFYQVRFTDGCQLSFYRDEEVLIEQVREISPIDVDGYRKIARYAEKCCQLGFDQLGDKPFLNLRDIVRLIPTMVRMNAFVSAYHFISRYIKDEHIRQFLCIGPLFIGGNPLNISALYLMIHWIERKWGAHHPVGGVYSVIKGLLDLLTDAGVECRSNADVQEVLVDKNGHARGVRLSDGEVVFSDIVVSNVDPGTTYRSLIKSQNRRYHSDARLDRRIQGPSLCVAYFSRPYSNPQLQQHTVLVGQHFREELNLIFGQKKIARSPSLYLHLPGRTEDAMAPDGQDAGYVLSIVPNLQGSIDWETEVHRQLDRVGQTLEAHGFADFFTQGTIHHVMDPREFSVLLRSVDGAAFGLEPLLLQTACFRYKPVSEDVPGLYFVGAGTHPGAGIPGVLLSAKILSKVVPAP